MSALWLILCMGAGVYAIRIAGLVLPNVPIPPAWERALGFLPVALLTALVVSSFVAGQAIEVSRIIAAVAAGIVVYRTRRMWACILSGMVVYWLLRLI